MAASPATYRTPAGRERKPESVGMTRVVDVDVVWLSTGAASTADKTINASDLGLNHISGVDYLGDVGALYSGAVTVGMLSRTFVNNTSVNVSGLSAAGGALSLNTSQVAAARVRVIGD